MYLSARLPKLKDYERRALQKCTAISAPLIILFAWQLQVCLLAEGFQAFGQSG